MKTVPAAAAGKEAPRSDTSNCSFLLFPMIVADDCVVETENPRKYTRN